MKSKITTIMMVLLAVFITLGGTTSCKSKKRLAREAAEAEYKSKVEQALEPRREGSTRENHQGLEPAKRRSRRPYLPSGEEVSPRTRTEGGRGAQ